MASQNFDHLKALSAELHRLGVLAEQFFAIDANTSLIKSRQFGEYMVKEIAALSGVYDRERRETTHELLRRLSAAQIVPREVADVFHAVRKSGNEASHDLGGTPAEALSALKFCRTLGVWYRRAYGRDLAFRPSPFVPPKPSDETDAATQAELESLRQQVREAQTRLEATKASAEELSKARAAAEELARQAVEESAVWEKTAIDLEADHAELAKTLAQLQAEAAAKPDQQLLELRQASREAASRLELDERQTRLLIDAQLAGMGWEADSITLRHAAGARPEEGRDRAIAEWPTDTGPVDLCPVLRHELCWCRRSQARSRRRSVGPRPGRTLRARHSPRAGRAPS